MWWYVRMLTFGAGAWRRSAMTAWRAPARWSHSATRSRITKRHHTAFGPDGMVWALVRDSQHRRLDRVHPGQAAGVVPPAPAGAVPPCVHGACGARLGDRRPAPAPAADRDTDAALGDRLLPVGADRHRGPAAGPAGR